MNTGFKQKIRIFTEKVLRFLSIIVLKKYKPFIIGITGSVGKTSAKEAIYAVLKNHFSTRKNIKNYNNEIGIPLTILGIELKKNIFSLVLNFIKILGLILLPLKYPKKLVLEIGVDHPGDIKYLASFINFRIGVITEISEVHLEFFGSIDKILKEKGTLLKVLPEKGLSILNKDSRFFEELAKMSNTKIITFGFSKEADIHVDGAVQMNKINPGQSDFTPNITFKVNYMGNTVPIRLPGVFGEHQVYAALAGISAGLSLGMNLIEISEGLRDYLPPPGRMRCVKGVKNSIIIDDTYNASPKAMLAALNTLGKMEAGRKIAVLGDMVELGSFEEEGHRQVGGRAAGVADILITVGERAEFILDEAMKNGFSKHSVFRFRESEEAGKFLQNFIKQGDLILAKGSQAVRMEKIVKEIMAEPGEAAKLLCRQDEIWQNR